jgi:hypothetical protein
MPKFSSLSVLVMVSMLVIIFVRVALNSEVQVAAGAAAAAAAAAAATTTFMLLSSSLLF